MDVDYTNAIIVVLRLINAALWTVVIARIIRNNIPATRLVRQLLCLVIVVGMWVVVINGLATALPAFPVIGGQQRFIYTAYTVFAGIIALAIAIEDPDGSEEK